MQGDALNSNEVVEGLSTILVAYLEFCRQTVKDKPCPIVTALCKALLPYLEGAQNNSTALSSASDFKKIVELISYLPPIKGVKTEAGVAIRRVMAGSVSPYLRTESLKRFKEIAAGKSAHRPIEVRRLATLALQMREQSPRPSWKRIARDKRFGNRSSEAIRQAAIRLQRFLRKH